MSPDRGKERRNDWRKVGGGLWGRTWEDKQRRKRDELVGGTEEEGFVKTKLS